jgi:hypothetical protein
MNFSKSTPQSFISDNFLHTHGEHGLIGNFLEEWVDTLKIKDKGLGTIASLEHLAEYKEQVIGIIRIQWWFLLFIHTGKTIDITSNIDNLEKTRTEKVVSLDNLTEKLVFMAEFMPGFKATPSMKQDTLNKHLSEYFDIKISNNSNEPFILLERAYPAEVSQLLHKIGAKKEDRLDSELA